jgi:hypothetical protein
MQSVSSSKVGHPRCAYQTKGHVSNVSYQKKQGIFAFLFCDDTTGCHFWRYYRVSLLTVLQGVTSDDTTGCHFWRYYRLSLLTVLQGVTSDDTTGCHFWRYYRLSLLTVLQGVTSDGITGCHFWRYYRVSLLTVLQGVTPPEGCCSKNTDREALNTRISTHTACLYLLFININCNEQCEVEMTSFKKCNK